MTLEQPQPDCTILAKALQLCPKVKPYLNIPVPKDLMDEIPHARCITPQKDLWQFFVHLLNKTFHGDHTCGPTFIFGQLFSSHWIVKG